MYRSRQPVHVVRARTSRAPTIDMFSNVQTRVSDCSTLCTQDVWFASKDRKADHAADPTRRSSGRRRRSPLAGRSNQEPDRRQRGSSTPDHLWRIAIAWQTTLNYGLRLWGILGGPSVKNSAKSYHSRTDANPCNPLNLLRQYHVIAISANRARAAVNRRVAGSSPARGATP
jgi:hypothetical protein